MEWVLEIADFLEENNINFSVKQSATLKNFYIEFPDDLSGIVYLNNVFYWGILVEHDDGKIALHPRSAFHSIDDLKKKIIKLFKE